jgi:hypothetical protein
MAHNCFKLCAYSAFGVYTYMVEAELEMPDPIEEIAFGAGGKSSLEFSNQQNQQSRLSPEDREQLEEFEDMDMQERMEYLNNKNKS